MIPQNENSFFEIKKYLWESSISVSFNTEEDIDVFNLFLIIKSYVNNFEIFCNYLAITYSDLESNIYLTEKINTYKLRNIDFKNFVDWFEWRISYDKKYEKKEKYINFVFIFEKKIIEEKKIDLNELSPIYPWKNDFIEIYKKDMQELDYLKKKIKNLEKIIEDLKKNTHVD